MMKNIPSINKQKKHTMKIQKIYISNIFFFGEAENHLHR